MGGRDGCHGKKGDSQIAQIDRVSGLSGGDSEVAMVQTGIINSTGVSRSRASKAPSGYSSLGVSLQVSMVRSFGLRL